MWKSRGKLDVAKDRVPEKNSEKKTKRVFRPSIEVPLAAELVTIWGLTLWLILLFSCQADVASAVWFTNGGESCHVLKTLVLNVF